MYFRNQKLDATNCRVSRSGVEMSMYDSSHKTTNRVLVALCLLVAFGVGLLVDFLVQVPPVPVVEDTLWGSKNDKSIRPFRINISDEALKDLRYRLLHRRPLQASIDGAAQNLGMNNKIMNKITNFWLNDYNWRERENMLNKYPHFKTEIQGLDIHFVHIKPKTTKKTVPIMLFHGFPGSFRDFYDIIPHLTRDNDKYDFVFEMIIPSLPGFTFSDHTNKSGLSFEKMTLIMKNLMKRLGHETFYIYGSDLGALLASDMATIFPRNILGAYFQISISFRYISVFKHVLEWVLPDAFFAQKSMHYIPKLAYLAWMEMGYFHMQTTKPDMLSYAINDSPIGLAAYIIQILSAGANAVENVNKEDAGLDIFNYADIIDHAMLYWLSGSVRTSLRYKEMFRYENPIFLIPISSAVPCSCPVLKKEIFYQNPWILKDKYTTIVQSSVFDHSHFILNEKNETIKSIYSDDIFSSVVKMIDFRKNIKL